MNRPGTSERSGELQPHRKSVRVPGTATNRTGRLMELLDAWPLLSVSAQLAVLSFVDDLRDLGGE